MSRTDHTPTPTLIYPAIDPCLLPGLDPPPTLGGLGNSPHDICFCVGVVRPEPPVPYALASDDEDAANADGGCALELEASGGRENAAFRGLRSSQFFGWVGVVGEVGGGELELKA